MITKDFIIKMAIQFQTSEENIAREYIQHLFLSFLYRNPKAKQLLFKGGTALRLIYKSPRFSEDLDFTGLALSLKLIEDMIAEVLSEIEKIGAAVKIVESKETTGGYLGKFTARFLDYHTMIKFEVSLRKTTHLHPEATLIENDYLPSYTIFQMPQEKLIEGKIDALLEREKPRDYFDIYFLLRANLLSSRQKNKLKVIMQKAQQTTLDFKKDLAPFLPKSHQPLIKSLKANLLRELGRFLA